VKYQPNPDIEDQLVREDLERVKDTLRNPDHESMFLAQRNVAPAKVTDGMVVYADGTNWNPGSGEGAYIWYAAAWNFLG